MKRRARAFGLVLIVGGLIFTAFSAILYAERCPNDPTCLDQSLINLWWVATVLIGAALFVWGRRKP